MLSKFAVVSSILLSFPALIAGQDATGGDDKIGYSGELDSRDAGLGGTVNVVDSTTLEIPDFVIEDASAPALYWWGATDENLADGFRISEKEVTEEADGELLEIPLDSGMTTADFSVVGLWCEEFNVNFGQTTLEATDGSSSSGSGSSSASANDDESDEESDSSSQPSSGSRDSSKNIFEPVIEDQYNSARAYFLSVVGLLFLESAFHLPLFLLILFKRGKTWEKPMTTMRVDVTDSTLMQIGLMSSPQAAILFFMFTCTSFPLFRRSFHLLPRTTFLIIFVSRFSSVSTSFSLGIKTNSHRISTAMVG